MRSKWVTMLVVAVLAVLLVASAASAQFLLCISEPKLKGEKTIAACNKEGDRFAFVSKSGLVFIPTQEELNLTMAFRPKIGSLPAYGMQYGGQASRIPPLPPIGDQ
jgi:hypothetical protein